MGIFCQCNHFHTCSAVLNVSRHDLMEVHVRTHISDAVCNSQMKLQPCVLLPACSTWEALVPKPGLPQMRKCLRMFNVLSPVMCYM